MKLYGFWQIDLKNLIFEDTCLICYVCTEVSCLLKEKLCFVGDKSLTLQHFFIKLENVQQIFGMSTVKIKLYCLALQFQINIDSKQSVFLWT